MGQKHAACEDLRCLIESKGAQVPVVALKGSTDIMEPRAARPDDAVGCYVISVVTDRQLHRIEYQGR